MGILKILWDNLVGGGYMVLLDGFSKVPYCSTEGRALMSMDVASYRSGISARSIANRLEDNQHLSCPLPTDIQPYRTTAYVDTYIKIFYFPSKVSLCLWLRVAPILSVIFLHEFDEVKRPLLTVRTVLLVLLFRVGCFGMDQKQLPALSSASYHGPRNQRSRCQKSYESGPKLLPRCRGSRCHNNACLIFVSPVFQYFNRQSMSTVSVPRQLQHV